MECHLVPLHQVERPSEPSGSATWLLSVDGTKVRANASKRKAMSYGRMLKEEARLKKEIAGLLDKAGAVDAEEDERYGEQVRGDELPAELERREKRLRAIQQAKARLEAAQREADDARGRKPGQYFRALQSRFPTTLNTARPSASRSSTIG